VLKPIDSIEAGPPAVQADQVLTSADQGATANRQLAGNVGRCGGLRTRDDRRITGGKQPGTAPRPSAVKLDVVPSARLRPGSALAHHNLRLSTDEQYGEVRHPNRVADSRGAASGRRSLDGVGIGRDLVSLLVRCGRAVLG
jgi:hypothetical protein